MKILSAIAALTALLCFAASFETLADDEIEGKTEDRIFFFSLKCGSYEDIGTDMMLIESNGHYGLVDTANVSSPDIYPTPVVSDAGLYDSVNNGKHHGEFIRDVLGVDHLDFILATHAHSDHIGGVTEIAELGLVDSNTVLIYKEYLPINDTEDYLWHNIELVEMARNAVADRGGKIVMIKADSPAATDYSELPGGGGRFMAGGEGGYGDHINFVFGDFVIDLFNIDPRVEAKNNNSDSILTLITKDDTHMLLLSDINNYDYLGANLADAISGYLGGARIDLLKDAHHGTPYGSNTKSEAESYRPVIDISTRAWGKYETYGNFANYKYYCESNYGTVFYAVGDSERAVVADISDGSIIIREMLDDGSYSESGMPVNRRPAIPGWSFWDFNRSYLRKVQTIEWHYFNNDSEWDEGVPGWGVWNHKRFYLTPSETDPNIGEMAIGWKEIDGKRYFFDEDGAALTGKQEIDGTEYYFNDNGSMADGWTKIGDLWYYFNSEGTMQTGWQLVDDKWYYLESDGVMATGWKKLSDKWYYLGSSGAMAVGWRKVDGKWYYFHESGRMATGWLNIEGAWYYLKSSGAMAKSEWITSGGKQYYLRSTGEMAVNEWVPGHWWVGADGVWTYKYKASWHKDSRGWWFGDTSGWFAKNCTIKIDGKKYTFDAGGYMK